ncbi:MAG TPA: cobalamin-binding protein [Caulifigura sp.]|nr:cobalamin-binding protein [Caulifigura sp.]
MRIVSFLPSATEIVCELGLQEQLVGVTHECDFPTGVASLPHVTRTHLPAAASSGEIDRLVREQLATERSLYQLDHDRLAALEPDLIITQSLCDVCAVAESDVQRALCRLPRGAALLNLEPQSLTDVLDSVVTVADAAGIRERGVEARRRLQNRMNAVTEAVNSSARLRVVVLEWIDPPFSAGHWVPEIVELAGGQEMIGRAGQRSVTLDWDQVAAARPEVLFISCCGFSIERTKQDLPLLFDRLADLQLPCFEHGNLFVLDGSAYLSRPGPRLVEALELMAQAMHPEHAHAPSHSNGLERAM